MLTHAHARTQARTHTHTHTQEYAAGVYGRMEEGACCMYVWMYMTILRQVGGQLIQEEGEGGQCALVPVMSSADSVY